MLLRRCRSWAWKTSRTTAGTLGWRYCSKLFKAMLECPLRILDSYRQMDGPVGIINTNSESEKSKNYRNGGHFVQGEMRWIYALIACVPYTSTISKVFVNTCNLCAHKWCTEINHGKKQYDAYTNVFQWKLSSLYQRLPNRFDEMVWSLPERIWRCKHTRQSEITR